MINDQMPIEVLRPTECVELKRTIRNLLAFHRQEAAFPIRWLVDLRNTSLVHIDHDDLAELGKVISMLIDGATVANYFVGVVAVNKVDLGLANVVRVFAEPSVGQLEVLLSTDLGEVEGWLDGVG